MPEKLTPARDRAEKFGTSIWYSPEQKAIEKEIAAAVLEARRYELERALQIARGSSKPLKDIRALAAELDD